MKMGLSHILHDYELAPKDTIVLGSVIVKQNVRHGPGRLWAPCFGPTPPSSHTADRCVQLICSL